MSRLAVDKIVGANTESIVDFSTITSLKMPPGAVLQVLQGERLTIQSNSSNTYADVVTQAITPKFSTSKILIQCSGVANSDGNNACYFKLFRDTTEIGSGTGGDHYNVAGAVTTPTHSSGDGFDVKAISIQHLDSPSTTSAITYKLQAAAYNGSTNIGGRGGNNDIAVPTKITLMEIAQ